MTVVETGGGSTSGESVTRIAAVDCGTNSIRLLVSECGDDGSLSDVVRQMRIVRLGQDVDRTGRLAGEAIERTRVALRDYVTLMKLLGVARVRMVATSATRDADNREEFFAMTAELLGEVVPGAVAEVISGDEEARLSFAGAVGDLDPSEGPFVVTDLGGGSTEVVVGDARAVRSAYSANIGCVRLTERVKPADPPSDDDVAQGHRVAADILAGAFDHVSLAGVRTWVGVAGTMTTISAVAQDLPSYDPERIHLSRLSLTELGDVCERLIHMSKSERAEQGAMHPGRVDVIGSGAIICEELARVIGSGREGSRVEEMVVSEHDILDGIAMSIA